MASNKKNLVLFSDKKIYFSLYRNPPQGAEAILEAADELIHYLEKSLGQEIPQFDNSYPLTLTMNLNYCSDLLSEEFLIEVNENGIVLSSCTIQGMFHAVYYFLENWLGIRWLWPGKEGEVVPKTDTLIIPFGKINEKPDYLWRAIKTGGAVYEALDFNTALHSVKKLPLSYIKEFNLWCRRNRFGGLNIADGHRWSEIAPAEKYGKEHPEFYALHEGKHDNLPHDGKHGNQPCLTNEGVIDIMAGYANARFKSDPALDVFSISPNDGGYSCSCDNCKAVDAEAGAENIPCVEDFDHITRESGYEGGDRHAITDRLFYCINKVAEKVSKEYPHKMLLTHLYSVYRTPPVKSMLHPYVIGQYCVMGSTFHDCEIRDRELSRIKGFAKSTKHLGIYEYYSNGAWPEIHRLFPDLVEASVRDYYNAGVRYFSTQASHGFACNGINLYVLGRMLWDVDCDANDIVDDYCIKGFGNAAPVIKNYIASFVARWKETNSGMGLSRLPSNEIDYTELYDSDFLADRKKELEQALELAGKEYDIKERIGFLMKGLEYTSRFCRTVESTKALYPQKECSKNTSPDCEKLETAVKARTGLKYIIEQYKGKFVFSDFWVNYRDHKKGADNLIQKTIEEGEKEFNSKIFNYKYENDLTVFESSGSPYERGLAVGQRFKELIHEGYDTQVNKNLSEEKIEILKTSMEYVRRNFPYLYEEFEGLAEGTGLSVWQIFNYNSFNAVSRVVKACSIVATADENGNMMLGGNVDNGGDEEDRKYYFTYRVKTGTCEALLLHWAGTGWSHGGLNSHGLALTSASTPGLPTRDYAGLPQHLAVYAVLLNCKDVPSALDMLSRTNFMGKGQNIGMVDKQGNVAMVEKSSCYQGVSQGRGITMLRTNHFFTEEMLKYNEHREEGSSGNRYRHARKLLSTDRYTDSYGTLKSVLASHGHGGLCRHNISVQTRMSLILNPVEGWAEFCGGHPCTLKYNRIYF